jgi:hypothetical protein
MEIGEGNKHLDAIHISLQTSRQNEKNLKSTNIRSIIIIIIIIQIQNMNIKLNYLYEGCYQDISKGTLQMQILKKMI